MNKFARAAIVALAATAGSTIANAADMPLVYKAPQVVPAFNWTGFYVGGNVGYGAVNPKNLFTTTTTPVFAAPENNAAAGAVANRDLSGRTFLGGLHAGYNWQFQNVVAGVEADATLLNYNKTIVSNGILPAGLFAGTTLTATNSFSASSLFTLRGRLGLAGDRFLVFATAGAAFAKLDMESQNIWASNTFQINHSVDGVRTGYVIGGGLEYAVVEGWLLRLEYLHVQFGTYTSTVEALSNGVRWCGTPASPFPLIPSCAYSQAINPSLNLVRVGVSKKF